LLNVFGEIETFWEIKKGFLVNFRAYLGCPREGEILNKELDKCGSHQL
jgi:hypothetical protein